MGVPAPCNFELVDATPYRLRYRCTGGGQGVSYLTNDQMQADALQAADNGAGGTTLLSRCLDIAVVSQAQARRVLMADDSVAAPAQAHIDGYRVVAEVTPRQTDSADGAVTPLATPYTLDAQLSNANQLQNAGYTDPNTGAVIADGFLDTANRAVYVLIPPTNAPGDRVAYLDVKLIHSATQHTA